MGSTLRSLVLRYKADHKDFTRGTDQVKKELRQTRDEVKGIDQTLRKTFQAGSVAGMKNEIKALNAIFRDGRMDVRKYGDEVDRLKQKIASVQRVDSIRSHERGALGRRLLGERDASRVVESRESIIARMGGDGSTAAGVSRLSGLAGLRNFGTLGKVARVAGPAAAAAGLAHMVIQRGGEFADGAQSNVAHREFTERAGHTFRGIKGIAGDMAGGFRDAVTSTFWGGADALTFGGLSSYGRSIKAEENRKAAEVRRRRESYEMKDIMDAAAAASPMRAYREATALGGMSEKETIDALGGARADLDAARTKEGVLAATKEIAILEGRIVAHKQEQVALDASHKQALAAHKDALAGNEVALERELERMRMINSGMSESEADLRQRGASEYQILRDRGLRAEIAEQESIRMERERFKENEANKSTWNSSVLGDFVGEAMENAAQGARSIARLKERIKNNRGVDPLNAFSPNAIAGSAADARLTRLNEARVMGTDKTDKMVKLLEQAVEALKEGREVKIEVDEVSF